MSNPLPYPQWLIREFASWLIEHEYISGPADATPNKMAEAFTAQKSYGYCCDDCDCGDLAYHKYLYENHPINLKEE